MKVKVANNLYEMTVKEYKGLLNVASEQVKFGIYAVERNGYAELCRHECSSMTELKKLKRGYRKQGFRVYCNA